MNRWPLHKAYFWERIPFFRLLMLMVVGILLYPHVSAIWVNTILIVACITAVTYWISSIRKQQSGYATAIVFIAFNITLALAGWLLSYYHDIRNDNNWIGNSKARQANVVEVTTKPVEKLRSWKLEVDITHSIYLDKVYSANGKAFVYVSKYNAPAYKEGDVLIVPGGWEAIRNNGNPYEFDYAAYLNRNNIYQQQFVQANDIHIYKYADEQNLSFIRQIHYWCVEQLERYIHDANTLGLLKAMLAGEQSELDRDLQDAYADTGIIHVISISGAHITIFFVFVSALLGWIKHRKYRWVKYLAALPLIWLYVLMAGAPPPALRAAFMFSILAIGFALQKNPNGINQLLATAFILLCVDPSWLYAIGFQLSFLGVLSIFLFYKTIYKLVNPVNKPLRALWSVVAVSIAAEVLIAPVVIYYFHSFPLQFIIANVLAYIFMGVILIAGMMIIACSSLPTVALFISDITVQLNQLFNKIILWLQSFSPDVFKRLTLTEIQLVILFIAIVCLAVFLLKKQKRGLFAGMISTCLLLFSFCITEWQALHQKMLIVYNTSKGNHIEIVNGKTAYTVSSKDTITPETQRYVLDPAHINLHVNKVVTLNKPVNYLRIAGKEIFIAEHPVNDTTIKADIVILNGSFKGADTASIRQVFHPALVVTTGSMNRKATEAFTLACKTAGLAVHDTRSSGAYMLRDN